jgi:formamidopyrimidine-DNA glycosylase
MGWKDASFPARRFPLPELPEVETIRCSLVGHLQGRRLTQVAIYDAKVVAEPDPATLSNRLRGQTVREIGRRGKFLVFQLDDWHLVVHLRMSGRLRLLSRVAEPRYLRARWDFDSGVSLCLYDVRRFGRMWMVDESGLGKLFALLGPEPLDEGFTPTMLGQRLAGRTAPIKAVLLDQHTVAGVGNIYADESLFQSRIHPARSAGSLTPEEVTRLHAAIRQVLMAAIAHHGTSFDHHYRDSEGRPGGYQGLLSVYRCAGKPCPVCGTLIARTKVAQRGTHYCPACQPLAAS